MAALGVAAAQAPTKNPFAGDAAAAETGRVRFRGACSLCHGIKGEGGRGPDLTLGAYAAGDTDADVYNVIANGSPGTEMPEFASRLEPEEIWQLVSFLRSIAKREAVKITGNRDAGQKLYWEKGQCGQCHRIQGKGGRMGPDLTRIGRQRSLAYLKESILNPSADLTMGYPTITVVTRDGKKITGVQKAFSTFSAQLMDASENFHSFFSDEVASIKREFRSLMPDAYRTMFTETELNDLLAYLASLRGTEGKK
jgi:putative heme-binding domain-containing protein